DRSVALRAWLLGWRIRLAGGIDILMTHAPPLLPSSSDPPVDRVHQGFEAFTRLAERFRPQILLHGHTHLGYGRGQRERRSGPRPTPGPSTYRAAPSRGAARSGASKPTS